MDLQKLPEVTLECLDEESAQEVMRRVAEIPLKRLGRNAARREGVNVIITYDNKMWPFDLADMAGELGLAGDHESARVIACL
jgi:hypothetical protein